MNKKLKIGFCLLASVLALTMGACNREEMPQISADEIVLESNLSTNKILIGNEFKLQMRVYHPAKSRLESAPLEENSAIIVRDQTGWEQKKSSKGSLCSEMEYSLSSFELGQHSISNGAVICQFPDGKTITNQLSGLSFTVGSSLTKPNDQVLDDIKGAAHPPREIGKTFLVMAAIILAGLLSGAIATLIIKRKTKTSGTPKEPPQPAHRIAADALDILEEKGWIEEARAYPFYYELSLIWRYYLQNRFQIFAPEKTTEEIGEAILDSHILSDMHMSALIKFLQHSDAVKFARDPSDPKRMQNSLELCRRFVEGTREDEATEEDYE